MKRVIFACTFAALPFVTATAHCEDSFETLRLAADAAGPGAAAITTFKDPAEGPAPSAVETRSAAEFRESLSSAMALQGAVLGMLSRATGFDPLALSLGMAAIGKGIDAGDWNKLGADLQEIDSDWNEIETVLAGEVRSPNFSESFRRGEKLQPRDLAMLNRLVTDLPHGVEVRRNTRYLDWLYKWEDGDPSAAGIDFRNNEVRRAGDNWMITLGEIPGAGGAGRLRVTLAGLPGRPADAKPQMDKLLASPLLTRDQRADLLALADKLSAAKLLPPGYAAAQ